MPRYFFDSDDGDDRIVDDEGLELPDDQAAYKEASTAIVELAKDRIPADGPLRHLQMWVRNEEGLSVHILTLKFEADERLYLRGT
ncbi:MAG: hypothetical protein JWR75_1444 [Devosia sp.]|nr:hypothetical protein [Devosia sp.]